MPLDRDSFSDCRTGPQASAALPICLVSHMVWHAKHFRAIDDDLQAHPFSLNAERIMPKKTRTAVPDFARQKPNAAKSGAPALKPAAGAKAPAPRVKPQATSAKSGRRGS